MSWMLDTNICIELIRRRPAPLLDRLRTLDVSSVCISAITLAELEHGVARSARPEQNAIALAAMLAPLRVAPFEDAAAACYGVIRADLERKGQPIGAMDLLIGAHALSLGATLVTHNDREFRRIDGLRVERWS